MTIGKIINFKYLAPIFFGMVGLGIMLPLLKPGFIFALDMAFTPNMPIPDFASSSLPFHWTLHMLAQIIPADWLQKILLFLIIWLAGFGSYKLVIYLLRDRSHEMAKVLAGLVAGLFFVINPFFFTRFAVGQLGVLMGFSLLPWITRAILEFLDKPALKTALKSSLLVTLASIVSIHSLGIVLLIIVFAFLAKIIEKRRGLKIYSRPLLRWSMAGVLVFLLIGSFWIVPLLRGHGHIAASISNFGPADEIAFATSADEPFGLVGNVAALYGFWADESAVYILPKDIHDWWWMVTVLLWVLIAVGIVYGFKRLRVITSMLAGIGIGSLVLAIGASFPPNRWLTSAVPWFAGYREPQKFAGLLALVFAGFLAFAAYELIRKVKQTPIKSLIAFVFLALPLIYTPTMLWGLDGQLKASDYPVGWYRINDRLNQTSGDFKVLFLPWHQYMPFDFTERTIINPAIRFFDKTTIVSNRPELLDLKPQVPNEEADFVNELLNQPDKTDLSAQLKARGFRFIILAREYDYEDYAYLSSLSNIRQVVDEEQLILYEVF